MTKPFDRIAWGMMREFESVGSVNPAPWIQAHPEHRADILDLACWLDLDMDEDPIHDPEAWLDQNEVARHEMFAGLKQLRQAALEREESELATQLKAARKSAV